MKIKVLSVTSFLVLLPMLVSASPNLQCSPETPVDCTNALTLYNSIATGATVTPALVTTATAVANTNPQQVLSNALSALNLSLSVLENPPPNAVQTCQANPQAFPSCSSLAQSYNNLLNAANQLASDVYSQESAVQGLVAAIQNVSPLQQLENTPAFPMLAKRINDFNTLVQTGVAFAGAMAAIPPELLTSQKGPAPLSNKPVSRSPVAPSKKATTPKK